MKKTFLRTLLLMLPFASNAQLRVGAPGSAVLYIGSNTSVGVKGTVSALNDIAGGGTLVLNGNSLQILDMGGKQVPNLRVNNTANINLLSNAVVSTSLTFTKGKIFTNNQLLTIMPAATITGYTATQFIATSDASDNAVASGGLLLTVPAAGSVLAPVGANSNSYNPVTINNTAGPAEQYTTRVNPVPVPGLNAALTLKTTWNITEATAGGNTIALTLQWPLTNEPGSFTRGAMKIVRSNGVSVLEKTGVIAATGSNPYVATGGAFNGTSIFGATSDPNAFTSTIHPVQPVQDAVNAENISMYPTIVTNNTAKLLINAPAEKRYLYVITDMNGKVLDKKEMAIWKGDNTVPVTLPVMAKGVYILNVYDGNILKKSIKFVRG